WRESVFRSVGTVWRSNAGLSADGSRYVCRSGERTSDSIAGDAGNAPIVLSALLPALHPGQSGMAARRRLDNERLPLGCGLVWPPPMCLAVAEIQRRAFDSAQERFRRHEPMRQAHPRPLPVGSDDEISGDSSAERVGDTRRAGRAMGTLRRGLGRI